MKRIASRVVASLTISLDISDAGEQDGGSE